VGGGGAGATQRSAGPAEPGQGRARIVTGPLAQVAGVGALDHHEVDPQALDPDASERIAEPHPPLQRPREEAAAPALAAQPGQRARLQVVEALQLFELAGKAVLVDARVQGRQRLLPQQRDRRVGE
jgi:hypothetical protein